VLRPRAQCQLTLSFPPNSSRQKENLPQNPRLLLSESERHREGERDVRVGRGSGVLQRPGALVARRKRRRACGRGGGEPSLGAPEVQGVHPGLRDRQERVPLQGEPRSQPQVSPRRHGRPRCLRPRRPLPAPFRPRRLLAPGNNRSLLAILCVLWFGNSILKISVMKG
jgi:hypothetical protein